MFLQHCTYGRTIALVVAMAPNLAFAQTPDSEAASELAPAVTVEAISVQQSTEQKTIVKGFGKATDSQDLGRLRGGAEVVISNDQKLKGTVADNSATNVATGANSITSGAFANVSGIPIVIQNSGANVLIQNSTIINLQVH